MAYLPDEALRRIAEEVVQSNKPKKMTIRELLGHFATTRRKTHVKWWIDKGLAELNVQTEPDYKSEYVDSQILIRKAIDASPKEDFIQRLKLLESANRTPITVCKDDTLQRAMTLMMSNDYSQLPVMNSPEARSVDGIISWQSIGWSIARGNQNKKVSDFMNGNVTVLKYDMPILEAVQLIKEKEFVLVQKIDKQISGVVTITDLADEFFILAEPFLYLGQIETSIRVLLDDKFSLEELKEVKYGDDDREINSTSDLTFNEYIQLLRKGDNWEKLGLPLDKAEFTKKLEEVRDIRNEVMHFSSDQLDGVQEQILKKTAQFLKEILKA